MSEVLILYKQSIKNRYVIGNNKHVCSKHVCSKHELIVLIVIIVIGSRGWWSWLVVVVVVLGPKDIGPRRAERARTYMSWAWFKKGVSGANRARHPTPVPF